MDSRGAALLEIVIVMPLLLLLGGAISYFGYCQLLDAELNLLAWEGASVLARGQAPEGWLETLQGRQLLVDPNQLNMELKAGALSLSYPLPVPFWSKDQKSRYICSSWIRPRRN
jgi:hypothetical protein